MDDNPLRLVTVNHQLHILDRIRYVSYDSPLPDSQDSDVSKRLQEKRRRIHLPPELLKGLYIHIYFETPIGVYVLAMCPDWLMHHST
ncbi:hypothetical protein L2E82_19741 [Cichorium intybus]|uniref:Uncharacterized protein n=1 Tax=Cichorium intybus TaxID=13427 RepID=A0ACB9FCS8_CICIN|nr:hypothetical protein L2E82_19741 [Cichorium intybus]